MTGVGIWFSASLVNPTSIASLLRVFFWAWFVEWLCFVTEVILILYYYLTWDSWVGDRKKAHVRLGFNLALTSWLTMVIIVAILAFMMDPGNWLSQKTFLRGFLNPIYLPQLAFRTPLAMVMAAGAAFGVIFFSNFAPSQEKKAVRLFSRWILFWLPFLGLGGFWYLSAIPESMRANMNVALTTQEFTSWYQGVTYTIVLSVILIAAFAFKGAITSRVPKFLMLAPFLICVVFMGQFERSREFIRKPYAIGGYLYANGFRKDDYALLNRDGILKHAPYVSIREITEANAVKAGEEVFLLACTRCHTVSGMNSIVDKLTGMYGSTTWSKATTSSPLAALSGSSPS
ncbi:MAG: cytochrome c, partial [Proteobacteria bacterium]